VAARADGTAVDFGRKRLIGRPRQGRGRRHHDQVELVREQRRAYVARPTLEQARVVFEARRLIEPALLQRLIETLTPERVARLRQHQALEQDARRRDDQRTIVRLSGEFHTLLAELAGNTALARQMRELSTLTCLIIFLYDAPTATSCRADEHSEIIEAVSHRDLAKAQALMLEHLEHIEGSLRLEPGTGEVDLEAIFRE
jgi:DNA-binding GntR family transcriptional regulator